MEDRWDPLAEVICPYDETHVISVKRFQRHLIKCRQNHPEKDFVTCPFNARHMFLRSDLRKHLSHCADRVTLDPDVLQEEDPETGETLRLKGKTDMPKAPENIRNSAENWDDEIEENIAMKYAYQEEYLKLQGILNKPIEEEPILRRPILPIVNKPNLPLINKPVNMAGNGQLTSLRRPNVSSEIYSAPINSPKADNTNGHLNNLYPDGDYSDTRAPDCPGKVPVASMNTEQSRKHNDVTSNEPLKTVLSEITESDMNTILSKNDNNDIFLDAESKSNNYIPLKTNKPMLKSYESGDCDDTESLMSETSWTSSVYEPIRPYSNRLYIHPNPDGCHKDMLASPNNTLSSLSIHNTSSSDTELRSTGILECNGENSKSGVSNFKPMTGIARGSLLQSLQGSAFTPVIPKQHIGVNKSVKPAIGRGLMNGHVMQGNSPIESKKGVGRGNLKLAAMNFQAS